MGQFRSWPQVYVIRANHSLPEGWPCKIGYTEREAATRVMSLQTGSWCDLTLWATLKAVSRRTEGKIHAALSSLGRGLRGEWFALSDDQLHAARQVQWQAGVARSEGLRVDVSAELWLEALRDAERLEWLAEQWRLNNFHRSPDEARMRTFAGA